MRTILFSLLGMTLVMSAVILLLVLILKLFGRRITARCRYLVWMIVVIQLCVPLPVLILAVQHSPAAQTVSDLAETFVPSSITVPVSDTAPTDPVLKEISDEVRVPQDKAGEALSANPHATQAPEPETGIAAADGIPQERADASEPAGEAEPIKIEASDGLRRLAREEVLLPAFTALWLFGALLFLMLRLINYWRFSARISLLARRGGLVSPGGQTAQNYAELCDALGLRRYPALYLLHEPVGPLLCGFFRPRILMPELSLSDQAERGVLLHELTHYRSHDLWVGLVCSVAKAIHWFNPLAAFAVSRCMAEMELACDEEVLRGKEEQERLSYGNAVLEVVRNCKRQSSALTSQFSARKSVLKERFKNILDATVKRRGIPVIASVLVLCVLTGTLVSCYMLSGSSDPSDADPSLSPAPPDADSSLTGVVPKKMVYNFAGVCYEIKFDYNNPGAVSAIRTVDGVVDSTYEAKTDNGRLTSFEVYYADEAGTLTRNRHRAISYNGEGGVLSDFYYDDARGGRVSIGYQYIYDDEGRLLQEDYTRWADAVTGRTAYAYDDRGRIASKTTVMQDKRGPKSESQLTEQYLYDNGDKPSVLVKMQSDSTLSRTEYTYGENEVLLGEKYIDLQDSSFVIDYSHQKYGTVSPDNYEISYSYDEKGRLIEKILDNDSNTQTWAYYPNAEIWEYGDSDIPVSFERSRSNTVHRFSRETMKTEEFSKNAVPAQSPGSYIEWMEADAQTELAYRGAISEDDSQYLCSTTHSVWIEDLLGQVFWTPPSDVPEDVFVTEAEWLLRSLNLQDAHALCAQDSPAIAKLCVLFAINHPEYAIGQVANDARWPFFLMRYDEIQRIAEGFFGEEVRDLLDPENIPDDILTYDEEYDCYRTQMGTGFLHRPGYGVSSYDPQPEVTLEGDTYIASANLVYSPQIGDENPVGTYEFRFRRIVDGEIVFARLESFRPLD